MKERKKKFPTSWLSKQQKEILKVVCNKTTDTKTLSWEIARKFNNDQEIRIKISKKTEKEILTDTHRASMNRSLKRLRERGLLTDFGTKDYYGTTEKGLNWCKLNIDDFKETREKKEAGVKQI